ncbi:MAG: ATP-binding protein [Alphaproteobacteria bacterium]|nr:ATP-binding protein [Alphaproteobacteria bacterium]MBV9373188.1 ATP-binding protein [Alphaproteobacteria bacterium]MBV9900277.1 ATP-binding protein [Alphaproteobacteria bacterium]
MIGAAPLVARLPDAAAAPVAELLCARFRAALARFDAWRRAGGSTAEPGWRHHMREWAEGSAEGRRFGGAVAAADAALEAAPEGRMRKRLSGLFRLSGAERDLLDAGLALAADPGLHAAVGALSGRGEAPLTERLVIELFGHDAQPILRPSSPLVLWSLVEAGPAGGAAAAALAVDPDIAAAAFGRPGLDRRLAACADTIVPADLPVSCWPTAAAAAEIARLTEMKRSVRVLLAAPPGSGRVHFAAAVAERLGIRLIRIAAGEEDADLYMRAQRLALITGHGLYWDRPPLGGAPLVASTPVQFVAVDQGAAPPRAEGLVDLAVDLPSLSQADKLAVWSACGPALPAIDGPGADRVLAGARLADLLAAAEHCPKDAASACARIRERARTRLQGDAQLLRQPYGWADLVLADRPLALLRAIIAEMRARDGLLAGGERRAKYGGLGQSILFHGPPGTGKTMAAQVIAAELQVDLVRVDCASTISKYIGETAKNLRAIFGRVQGTGALLLFDEADALFARRTETRDALDRHANADTNYLLQLIEDFDGAAILTTNKKENVDPAFIRRIRHMVDFGAPGEKERRSLWRRHVAALSDAEVAEARLEGWCARLASLDLSPAQIKGAALTAAFLRDGDGRAAPAFADLVTGVERELAKEGRALDRRVRAELASHD